MNKFIGDNLFSIVSVLAVAGWMLFLFIMDARHEPSGTASDVAKQAEIKSIQRELREKKAYEDTDPGSRYSPARQMIIRELEDELERMGVGKDG